MKRRTGSEAFVIHDERLASYYSSAVSSALGSVSIGPTRQMNGIALRMDASTTTQRTIEAVLAEGQALERRAKRDEARQVYEAALHDGTATTPADAASLLRLIARAYLQDSAYAEAEDCAMAALAISERSDDEAGRGRAINVLATIHWNQGQHDEAQRLYLQARASAIQVGESRLAAMTASNLGVIATVRGDDKEALQYYESGLTEARKAGLVDEVINGLVNLGQLHTHTKNFAGADKALKEALNVSTVVGDLSRVMRIELHIAKLRIQQGEQIAARSACERARVLVMQTGDTAAEGDAEHVAGLIARIDGDVTRAEVHFLRAEEIALERRDLILQGETARELADMYRWNGRNRDTLHRLNQAHRLFLQLRARRELADVDRRTVQLETDFLDVARKWGDSIESKDIYTQGHCVRVADLACALWTEVNGGEDTTLFWFRIGALLHDVGKLMVPADVLNKSGKLDDTEWKLIRGHPTAGVELLADIEFPWDVQPIVESHHERWDGMGYPHKLSGQAIPLKARVLCIADVYDALTSKRSYKQPFAHADAMEIMRGDVGTAFDPELFATFENLMRTGTWQTPAGLDLLVPPDALK